MAEVVRLRLESARRQVETVTQFVTTPKGVFETLDEMIRTFRTTNRETLKALKIPVFGEKRRRIF